MKRDALYLKVLENSALSWCRLYEEEKNKREEIEERYNELTKLIRKQGKDRADKGDYSVFGYWH